MSKQLKGDKMSKRDDKVGYVMKEFKDGKLKSGGSGKKVTNKKQAVAIALSEAGVSKKAGGGRILPAKCRNGIAVRGRTRGRMV